jgi:hypothetical protein
MIENAEPDYLFVKKYSQFAGAEIALYMLLNIIMLLIIWILS